MRSQAEIEKSIRDKLPIIFGKPDPEFQSAHREKRKVLINYFSAAAEPFLAPETIRYQSILLSVALLFISVSLFRIDTLKVFESTVSVSRKLLVVYTVFTAMVAVIFRKKTSVDSQRRSLPYASTATR